MPPLLSRLFGTRHEQKKSLTLEEVFGSILGLGPTVAGPSIGAATAMRVPAVASAVQLIGEAVGTLPVKVFKRRSNAKRTADQHPAFKLVHGEANEWTSATEFRTALTRDALLNDNGGFALANRVNGKAVELIRLEPSAVSVKFDDFGEPSYEVGQGTATSTYPFTEILHVRAFGDQAPITRARAAIGLALVLEQHAARLFSQGARPGGVLSTGENMGGEAIKNVLEAWQLAHGNGNSGRPAILPHGMRWESIALNSVDAQFEEMRRFQTEEIARAFRVPPTMLFDLTRGTWSNTEEMAQQFLTLTLRPWLKAWEWAYERVLLTPEERKTHFVEFITDDLLTVSHAARAESYAKYRSMGVMTANEVRAGLNLPPTTGGDDLQNPYTSTQAANDNDEPAPADQEAEAA